MYWEDEVYEDAYSSGWKIRFDYLKKSVLFSGTKNVVYMAFIFHFLNYLKTN